MPFFQLFPDQICVKSEFFCRQTKFRCKSGHHAPLRAASLHIIAFRFRTLCDFIGIHRSIAGKPHIHHGKCSRSTSCHSKKIAAIRPVAPTLVPLQKKRYLAGIYIRGYINRRIVIFLCFVIKYKLSCLRISLIQVNQALRIILFFQSPARNKPLPQSHDHILYCR